MRATWPLLGSNGPYSRVPLAAFLEAEVRLGLDGVDFVPQTPHFWCSHTGHESAAPLRAALAEAGLPVRVLTPPPYRYSLTAPPGRQREATLYYYRVCIALAAELGAGRLVLGAAGACWDIEPEALRRNAAGLLSELCPQAEAAGVRLLLAPVMGPETPLIAESPVLGRLEELSELLRRVDSPALGVCLDTNVIALGATASPGGSSGWGAHRPGAPVRRKLPRLAGLGRGCAAHGALPGGAGGGGYAGPVSLLLPGMRYAGRPSWPEERPWRS
ncbi:MAG: sugar phosphate isomerase/epimerase family protein [Flavonifractor plautii]